MRLAPPPPVPGPFFPLAHFPNVKLADIIGSPSARTPVHLTPRSMELGELDWNAIETAFVVFLRSAKEPLFVSSSVASDHGRCRQ